MAIDSGHSGQPPTGVQRVVVGTRRWRRRRRRVLLLGVALAAAGLGIFAHAVGVFHRVELVTVDTRFRIRGSRPNLARKLVVVGIDGATFSHFNAQHVADRWPLPRREDARVIDELRRAGARQIAVDLQFTEPTDPTDDNDLARAVAGGGHVVLATTAVGPHGSTDVLGGGANLRRFGARVGNASLIPDADGVYRRMQYQLRGLVGFPVAVVASATGRRVSPSLFGGRTTPVPIDFAGPPGTVPFISYWRVYDGRFRPSFFRGKIVIVGATAPALQDVHETATSGSQSNGRLMSGPELVANQVGTILAGIPLRDGPGWINILAIVVLGVVPPLLGLRGWGLTAVLVSLALGGAYAIACQIAFDNGRIIAFIDPLFAMALGVLGTLAVVYLSEALEREYARTQFARFVPPAIVDQVLTEAGDDLRLGGVERICTVMFSDLRGFTSFSEAEPVEHVIEVVNHYLNEMTEAILDAGGTLVSYMGDGIMAVFGAPLEQTDHADRGLAAAREMLATRLPRFNSWLAAQGHPSSFRIGIGLNSGPVMCGNVGAEQRVEYTAIGDTTNTASRLEGMTKGTSHMLFVSGSTREWMRRVPDDLSFLGELEVPGKTGRMAVYSVPEAELPPEPSANVVIDPQEPEASGTTTDAGAG